VPTGSQRGLNAGKGRTPAAKGKDDMNYDIKAIAAQAHKELEEEKWRRAVDAYKEKLRNQKPLWYCIFPWKIIIVRKEKLL
jgi:pyruvate-formate lyase-activating enzyme